MLVCKFCEEKFAKLTDAHIIPKAFFKYTEKVTASKGKMLTITNTKNEMPSKKTLAGWYDQNLVCADCEKRFGPYDNYAAKLLLQKDTEQKPHYIQEQLAAWTIDEFSYKNLKLFIISVLWRMGASQRVEFKNIKLGPYQNKAKSLILEDDPGSEEDFQFILARFADKPGRSFIADPFQEAKSDAWGPINAYRIYLGGGYIAYIKVDKRPFTKEVSDLIVKESNPLYILNRGTFGATKDWESLKTTMDDSARNWQELKKVR